MKIVYSLITAFLLCANLGAVSDGLLYPWNIQTVDGTSIAYLDSSGNMTIAGTLALTGVATFTAGINCDEDVDIDFDAADEEFNLTTSSGGTTAAMTIYNSTPDLGENQPLLDLLFADNGDANGIFLRCSDNDFSTRTVLQVGADGVITIKADGLNSGTVLSEASLVANDAKFWIDSATQDLWIGASATNYMKFSDAGAQTGVGTAQITMPSGADYVCTATPEAGPWVSASSADSAAGIITFANTGGIDLDEDLDVDWDNADEEATFLNTAEYAADGAQLTINNTDSAPSLDMYLLRTRYTVNADTNARHYVAEDNNGDDVLRILYDGAIMTDVTPGAGSGTTISSILFTPNDAEYDFDSETQNINIGDVTGNEWVWTDDGAMSNSGNATITVANGDDIVCSATPESSPFLSASSLDTAAMSITFTQGIAVATATFSGAVSMAGNLTHTGDVLDVTYGVKAATAEFTSDVSVAGDFTHTGPIADITYGLEVSTIEVTGAGIMDTLDLAGNLTSGTSNVVMVEISYSLEDDEVVAMATLFSGCDVVVGHFNVKLGTHCAIGSFIADGTVTLCTKPSGYATTTNTTDGALNVSDGGTDIDFTNKTGAAGILWGTVRYQP